MRKKIFIILTFILILFLSNCNMQNSPNNVFVIDSLVIYNYDYKTSLSAITIKNDSAYLVPAFDIDAKLIVCSYLNNNIVFLSPSKDTIRFMNNDTTGIMDVGGYPYSYPPEDGYFDMEYINKEHYYFIKFPEPDFLYGRLYVYYYNFDSIICKLEILLEGNSFE